MAGMLRDRVVYDESYIHLGEWIRPVEQAGQRAGWIPMPGPSGQPLDAPTQRMLELFLNDAVGAPYRIHRLRLSLALWVLRGKLLEKTKRAFDLFFALGSLPLVLPVMGLIAAAI